MFLAVDEVRCCTKKKQIRKIEIMKAKNDWIHRKACVCSPLKCPKNRNIYNTFYSTVSLIDIAPKSFIFWDLSHISAGNAVIYSNYKQLQITDYRSCSKTLYLFAFWSTTLTNVLLFICCCCYCKEEADEVDVQV